MLATRTSGRAPWVYRRRAAADGGVRQRVKLTAAGERQRHNFDRADVAGGAGRAGVAALVGLSQAGPPASVTGLPSCGMRVRVGPPLASSGSSSGSVLMASPVW